MLEGKFVGPGIYVEDLDETHSYKEIDSLEVDQFKQLCSFMNEKEMTKMRNHCDSTNQDYRFSYLQNILMEVK